MSALHFILNIKHDEYFEIYTYCVRSYEQNISILTIQSKIKKKEFVNTYNGVSSKHCN